MEIDVTPEPPPGEREALIDAIERVLGRGSRPSAWWSEGVRENVESDETEATDT